MRRWQRSKSRATSTLFNPSRAHVRGILFILIAVIIFPIMFSAAPGIAHAVSSEYSDVLSDLRSDGNFVQSDYPGIANDNSLKVIQIAESSNAELFVYVYQPSASLRKLTATSINISTETGSLFYMNYKLQLLSASGVFQKYIVEGLRVQSESEARYYDISSIFRNFDDAIDDSLPNDNEINEVSFEVGQLWEARTVEDSVRYQMQKTETIRVTNKYVGFIRYNNGFKLFDGWCDSHYIAFSTDMRMDKLLEADVYFISQEVRGTINLTGYHPDTYGNETLNYKSLRYTDVASNHKYLFGKTYTWERIERAIDFATNEELTDETRANVLSKQWVLRFYETPYSEAPGLSTTTYKETHVSNVTILRLKFETLGKVYNLGVVDNKQTGDDKPGNTNTGEFSNPLYNFQSQTEKIAKVVLIVLVVVFLLVVIVGLVCLIKSHNRRKKNHE